MAAHRAYEPRSMLVTGGCGFIGSHFINHYVREHPDVRVANVDAMYYAASETNVDPAVRASPQYAFYKCNTANLDMVGYLLAEREVDTVVHFAAQTHVDTSFDHALQYTHDNVVGTHQLLEACRRAGHVSRFVHISTDEVYGESLLGASEAPRGEESVLNPSNPYAASKAAAEMYVNSYRLSFGFPAVVVRINNVYGPRQHVEKLIPRFIELLANGEKLTIHGRGDQLRCFVHVADVARAVALVIERGSVGEVYNVAGTAELSVRAIAQKLLDLGGKDAARHIAYVADRPFNDARYHISGAKLAALGWEPAVDFDAALAALAESAESAGPAKGAEGAAAFSSAEGAAPRE